jgi:hypothetical protein
LFQTSLAGYSPNGQSYLLYSDKDLPRAQELIDIKNELKQPVEPELYTIADKQFAMQSVPRRRLTLFEMLPEVSEENEVNVAGEVEVVEEEKDLICDEKTVQQYVEVVNVQSKQDLLKELIAKYLLHTNKGGTERNVVIFAQNKRIKFLATAINNTVSDKSRLAVGLGENLNPEQRQTILAGFQKTKKQTLVTSSTLFEKLNISRLCQFLLLFVNVSAITSFQV